MTTYTIPVGTQGKLIKLERNKDAEVVDWTTRKPLRFSASLIDPVVVKTMVSNANKSLAIKMAEDGYALFGGETGGDREAGYVLAIPYSKVIVNG